MKQAALACVPSRAIIVCLIGVLGWVSRDAIAAELQPGESLANAILAEVRARLPASVVRTADAQEPLVRAFARSVASTVIYPQPPGQLEAAARTAIDSASGQPTTASALVHAALAGVLGSIGHGAQLLTRDQPPPPAPRPMSFRDVGRLRIISLPTFTLLKMSDLDCSGFDPYFDFSRAQVAGLILDLRGNQGGSLELAVCLASRLVEPRVPIFTIRTVNGRDRRDTRALSGRPPVTLPVAVFIDKETDNGGLGLAAALQDVQRARVIGELKEKITDSVTNVLLIPRGQGMYTLPIGELLHADGRPLASGVRIDVGARASDDEAMLKAARKILDVN